MKRGCSHDRSHVACPSRRAPALDCITDWRDEWQRRWTDASQTTRTRVQVGVLLVSVLIAYNYSLSTLLQTADQQTPLAYISLVPAIALALAAIRARPLKPEPPIYDRHVDYTIGIPLILAAVAINELLPARMSAMFWVYRVDLLTLPIFVAGAVAIIFGSQGPVAPEAGHPLPLPGLALPVPEVPARACSTPSPTSRLLAMQKIAIWTHLAKPASSLDNTLFVVTHHGSTFALSVVSACSGVNGVVGFLLVGSAFAAIVRGPIVREGAVAGRWHGAALGHQPGRITFIFFAGKEWGESVAINVFHPFIGLVTFSLGVLVMILLIKPLGHAHRHRRGRPRTGAARSHGPDPGALAVRTRRPSTQEQGPAGRAEGLPGGGGRGGGRPRRGGQQRRPARLTTWWPG